MKINQKYLMNEQWISHENRSEGCSVYTINFASANGNYNIVKYLLSDDHSWYVFKDHNGK